MKIKDTRGNYQSIPADNIRQAARTLALNSLQRENNSPLLKTTDSVALLKQFFATYDHEVFAVMLLDNRHRVIKFLPMFNGTIDGASVHPREVVKSALLSSAAAVIFAHNHPSGIAEPSQADERITCKLKTALAVVDVRVLDHFVIAGDAHISFAERGLL